MKVRNAFGILSIAVCSFVSVAQVPDKEKVVAGAERAFEKAAKAVAAPAPGCAVGVSVNGQSVFRKSVWPCRDGAQRSEYSADHL